MSQKIRYVVDLSVRTRSSAVQAMKFGFATNSFVENDENQAEGRYHILNEDHVLKTLNYLVLVENYLESWRHQAKEYEQELEEALEFLKNPVHQQIVQDVYVPEFHRVINSYDSIRFIYNTIYI